MNKPVQTFDETERLMHAAANSNSADDLDMPSPRPSTGAAPHVCFSPVWSVAHEMISTYFATAYYAAHGRQHYGYSDEYRVSGVHNECDYLPVDLDILRRALATLRQSREAGLRFIIGYSVHSTTMRSDSRRRAYMDELNRAPLSLRRHLTGKIAEIELSAPRAAVTEWVSLLREASSRISLELSPNERRFEGLATTGAWAAGFVTPASQSAGELHGLIARWRHGLDRQQMRMLVDDVLTAGAFDLACEEKVDFITSSVLWPASAQPQGMLRASRFSARAAFGEPGAAFPVDAEQQA